MSYDELNSECKECDGLQWLNASEGYTCIAPDGACPCINKLDHTESLIKIIGK